MALSHNLHHPSHCPVATRTSFDPETRCLVVLCKFTSSKEALFAKTYVLSSDSIEKQQQPYQNSHPFPRLELPPPRKFPIFMLDQDRKNDGSKRGIFLVNLQGNPYLVDIFVGGGTSLNMYLLKTEESCHQKSTISIPNALPIDDTDEGISVSVLDNILCFSTSTHVLLLDACSSFSFVIPKMIEVPLKMTLRFFGQQYLFLKRQDDTTLYGSFHHLHLNLEKVGGLLQDVASRLSFLLQRQAPYCTKARLLVLQELNMLIERQTESIIRSQSNDELSLTETCRIWNQQVVTFYRQDVFELDCKNTIPLIVQCALLYNPSGNIAVEQTNHTDNYFDKDFTVLSQTEVLEEVLLVQANNAVRNGDNIKLGVVRDITIGMMSAFTIRSLPFCPGFYCLVIALLWRAGHDKEVLATVQSISEQTRRDTPGLDLLAEMILEITERVSLGCQASCNSSPLNIKRNGKQKDLVDAIFQCVSAFASPQRIARKLLERSQLKEAMALLTKVSQREAAEIGHNTTEGSNFSIIEPEVGLKGSDFFAAALSVARRDELTIADRCRLFYSLHHFLRIWDPTTLKLQPLEEEGTEKSGQHALGCNKVLSDLLTNGRDAFPDDLFGGTDAPSCKMVKALFGY